MFASFVVTVNTASIMPLAPPWCPLGCATGPQQGVNLIMSCLCEAAHPVLLHCRGHNIVSRVLSVHCSGSKIVTLYVKYIHDVHTHVVGRLLRVYILQHPQMSFVWNTGPVKHFHTEHNWVFDRSYFDQEERYTCEHSSFVCSYCFSWQHGNIICQVNNSMTVWQIWQNILNILWLIYSWSA